MHLCKRDAGGDWRQKRRHRYMKRRRRREDGGRDQKDAATSQGTASAARRSQKREEIATPMSATNWYVVGEKKKTEKEIHSTLEPLEMIWPCDTLILDF